MANQWLTQSMARGVPGTCSGLRAPSARRRRLPGASEPSRSSCWPQRMGGMDGSWWMHVGSWMIFWWMLMDVDGWWWWWLVMDYGWWWMMVGDHSSWMIHVDGSWWLVMLMMDLSGCWLNVGGCRWLTWGEPQVLQGMGCNMMTPSFWSKWHVRILPLINFSSWWRCEKITSRLSRDQVGPVGTRK